MRSSTLATVFLLVAVEAVTQTCVSPEMLANDGTFLCRGIVNYPFRELNMSLADMNNQAVRRVGGFGINATRAWYLLSTACLSSLKQLACIQTYVPCVPQRQPCSALCDAVDRSCGSQLLHHKDIGFSVPLVCSADDSNCTSGAAAAVGETREMYTGGACSDYVTDIAVVNFGNSWSPLQPAGFIQRMLDVEAESLISAIPTWASSTCQAAARALICASLFPVPTSSTLLKSNASLPRFSSGNNCATYASSCSEMFARAYRFLDKRLLSARNCSKRSLELTSSENGNSIISNRVIDLKLTFDPVSTAGVHYYGGALVTEPFQLIPRLPDSDVECVYGSGKIPSGRNNLLKIENTACAVACPIPYRTRSAFSIENSFNMVSGVASVLMSLYTCLTYTWIVERRRTQPLLACCFTIILMRRLFHQIPFLIDFTIRGVGDADQSAILCFDDVSRKVASDGGICTVQSYGMLASTVAEYVTAMFVALDVHVRVAYVPEDPNRYVYKYYTPLICLLTVLCGILPMAVTGAAGAASKYGRMEPIFCFARLDGKGALVYTSFGAVVTVAPFLTVCFMLSGVYYLTKAMRSVNGLRSVETLARSTQAHSIAPQKILGHVRSHVKPFHYIRIPLAFLVFRVGEMCWYWGVFNAMVANEEVRNGESLDSWYDCLFEHWQLSKSGQRAECGVVPSPYKWQGGQGLLESLLMMSVLRDVIYVMLFSLSRESVRAWIKQHPRLRPLFCNLDKKRDLLDRVTSCVSSMTHATMFLCESAFPSVQQVIPTEDDDQNQGIAHLGKKKTLFKYLS